MRGDLVERTAADLCRDLAASAATGMLAIDGPDGPARVVFADGRIIGASSPAPRARRGERLVGSGELDPDDLAAAVGAFAQEQVLDALFEIVRWRYGAFVFTTVDDPDVADVPVSLAVDDALVEVARRQQEWQQLSRVIPDLAAVPSPRQGVTGSSASLEPDDLAVLASVDGERSIRALASDLGYGEFEAARIVYGLSQLGIVEVRLPQDAIGAALEDALALGPIDQPPIRSDPPPPPDFFATGPTAAPPEPADPGTDDPPGEPPGPATDSASDSPPGPDVDDGLADIAIDADTGPTTRAPDPQELRPAEVFAALYGDAPRVAPEEPAEPDDPDEPWHEDDAADADPAIGAPQRGDDNDVSEFLRELSRLSGDAPERSGTPPPRRQPDPPPAPPDADSGRKKRRGLFGRS